jgi:hypothetical protein
MTAAALDGVEVFRIIDVDFDATTNTARLRYGFDDRIEFTELIEFGGDLVEDAALPGFERALRLLHLAAGVSYFKAAAPGRIEIETGAVSRTERHFLRDLYDKGLREFAVRNGLEVPLTIDVGPRASSPGDQPLAPVPPPRPGIAVPIGGGKDSIVVIEALRDAAPPADLPIVLLAVNPHAAMVRTADVAGWPLASIRRELSGNLFELNGLGALNGHVPITAVVSLLAVAAGYVYGYDTTLVALERSADEATAFVNGVAVNHQWSKSAECELALREVVRESVSPEIEYRSPLRSCGELEIARWFATLDRYHEGFRSCNRAFRGARDFDGWCGECPKCRFVYLMLAPFLARSRVRAIFGRDLLDEPEQVEGFGDLFAAGRKPFECVGEQRESLLAFFALGGSSEWRDAAVVRALRTELEKHRHFVEHDLDAASLPVVEDPSVTAARVTGTIARLAGRDRAGGSALG